MIRHGPPRDGNSRYCTGYYEAGGEIAATLTLPDSGDTNLMHGLKNALGDSEDLKVQYLTKLLSDITEILMLFTVTEPV